MTGGAQEVMIIMFTMMKIHLILQVGIYCHSTKCDTPDALYVEVAGKALMNLFDKMGLLCKNNDRVLLQILEHLLFLNTPKLLFLEKIKERHDKFEEIVQ